MEYCVNQTSLQNIYWGGESSAMRFIDYMYPVDVYNYLLKSDFTPVTFYTGWTSIVAFTFPMTHNQ